MMKTEKTGKTEITGKTKKTGKKGRFWKSLDKRLMIVISIIVIPVIVLAILLSSLTVRESKERVMTTYEKEFEVYISREVELYDKLDEVYRNYIMDYMDSILNPYLFSSVNSINMTKDLSNAMNLYDAKGFFFLQEKAGDEKIYLKGTRGLYEESVITEFKGLVKGRILSGEAGTGNDWHLEEFLGNPFCFICYRYQNYDIGIGIDLREQLRSWLEAESMKGSSVLLQDEKSSACWKLEGNCSWPDVSEKRAIISGMDKNSIHLSIGRGMDLYLMDIDMVHVVPMAYSVLQLVAYFSLLLLIALWFIIRRQVIHPLKELQKGMKEIDRGEWYYRIEDEARTDDFDYIYMTFNRMADDILLSHEKDIQLFQTQLDNLKLQVNPHMLLNSLTTVYSMVETKQYQTIQKFILNLVEYFRYCLRENNSLVPLKSELRFVENYMEIQKVRYPGELSFSYRMEPELEEALIPPLLIQNFVENAAKYARKTDEPIEILVNVRRENNRLYLSVCDTGKGIDPQILTYLNSGEMYVDQNQKKHIGIWNCRRRIEVFYGEEGSLRINSSVGDGTQVWIELPYISQGE